MLSCTDEMACNYNDLACEDDGSCLMLDECGVCELESLTVNAIATATCLTSAVCVAVPASLKASVTATATCLTHVACVEEQVSSVAPMKALATTTTSLQMTVLVCTPPRSRWT